MIPYARQDINTKDIDAVKSSITKATRSQLEEAKLFAFAKFLKAIK